jgi:methylated-DNA-[protein]-cysteine S-methyltransferase
VKQLHYDVISTPIGSKFLVVDPDAGDAICALFWTEDGEPDEMSRSLRRRYGDYRLERVDDPAGHSTAIRKYFAGDIRAIDSLAVTTGGTDFQRGVWLGLRGIPAGEVLTYGEFAARLGRPTAPRAVGMACGSNPVGLVLPCHRVVGSTGSLTGFGGGLDRKQWLLEHEHANLARLRHREQLPALAR